MSLAKLRGGIVPLFALLALGVGMAGCSGDDGDDGTDGTDGAPGATGPTGPAGGVGPTGPTGPAGPGAKIEPRESCGVCHSDGSAYGVEEAHAVTGKVAITGLAFAPSGADLLMTYNVKIDGAGATGLTILGADYRLVAGGAQFDLGTPVATDLGSGNYSVVLPGAAINPNSRYFLKLSNVAGTTHVTPTGDYPAAPRFDLVSDQSCNNCHGEKGLDVHATGDHPYGEHGRFAVCGVPYRHDRLLSGYINEKWVSLIHGIHNSHNMPAGDTSSRTRSSASRTRPT